MKAYLNRVLVAIFGKIFARGICRAGHYVEHAGFVALAGAETFAVGHGAIVIISAVLLVSGVFALVYDKIDGV